MSYASAVKKELTGITVHEKNARAELMALIRMNGFTMAFQIGKPW